MSWKAPFVWDAMPVREGAVYKGIPPVPLRDPGRSGEEGLNLGLARFFPSWKGGCLSQVHSRSDLFYCGEGRTTEKRIDPEKRRRSVPSTTTTASGSEFPTTREGQKGEGGKCFFLSEVAAQKLGKMWLDLDKAPGSRKEQRGARAMWGHDAARYVTLITAPPSHSFPDKPAEARSVRAGRRNAMHSGAAKNASPNSASEQAARFSGTDATAWASRHVANENGPPFSTHRAGFRLYTARGITSFASSR